MLISNKLVLSKHEHAFKEMYQNSLLKSPFKFYYMESEPLLLKQCSDRIRKKQHFRSNNCNYVFFHFNELALVLINHKIIVVHHV